MLRFSKGQPKPDLEWGQYRKKTIVDMARIDEPFECESREGTLRGQPGDYLAQDGHGGYYPVSVEFHRENYEAVGSEPPF